VASGTHTAEDLARDNAALRQELQAMREDNALLKLKVDQLLQRLFGRSSEKLAPGQLTFLGEPVEAPPPGDAPADEATHETPAATRRKRARERRLATEVFPRERVVYDPPEAACRCPECRGPMRAFGEDVTEELDFIPARLIVREHVRPKYSCPDCQGKVVQAPMPARPIEKGRPGPGLLAHILVSKFADHLPLYRQARIFERFGIDLARSTLCDWAAACADELQEIVREMRRKLLVAQVLQADETRLLVLENHNDKRRRECWLWVYRAPSGEVVFDFRETRARDGPREFLEGYQGYLQCDGYQGYGDLGPGVVLVGCFAHARRKFVAARDTASPEAAEALGLFAKLYAIEARAKDCAPEERAGLRRERALPVLRELEARLDVWAASALPRSAFGEAVAYTRNQWPKLLRYLEDGRLDIDTNGIERTIRGVAVGRKNYLFAGSYEGARRAAIFYSLIESCKAAGVEPYAYFADVLARTATASARELTPEAWKAAREHAAAQAPVS
jgi:transposase